MLSGKISKVVFYRYWTIDLFFFEDFFWGNIRLKIKLQKIAE